MKIDVWPRQYERTNTNDERKKTTTNLTELYISKKCQVYPKKGYADRKQKKREKKQVTIWKKYFQCKYYHWTCCFVFEKNELAS